MERLTDGSTLAAAQLKTRFGVHGCYYQMVLGGVEYPCRSLLELVAHHIPAARIPHHPPDLLVVMMNPGSSRPLAEGFQPPVVHEAAQIPRGSRLVVARPDNTQYQIMRVMAARGLVHARVMNLSDLRQPKSALFLDQVARLAQVRGGGVHSIFCPERQEELQQLLPPPVVPVLVGWGRDGGLLSLAEQCLHRLRGRCIIGVAVAGEPRLFAHPSPMLQRLKEQWVAAVLGDMAARHPPGGGVDINGAA